MAISASLSLYGIFQYDDTILDGLNVPTGMDADTVKNMLLIETAGMSILYPDAPFLKKAIALWSAERSDVWQKLYNTTVLEYDPIENYDRREESSEETIGNEQNQSSQERSTNSESHGTGQQRTQNSQNRNSGSESRGSSQQNTQDSQNKTTENESLSSNQQHRSGENTATAANTAYNSNDFADTSKTTSSGSDDVQDSTVNSGSQTESVSGTNNVIGSTVNSGSETESVSGTNDIANSTVNSGSETESISGSGNRSSTDRRRLSSRIHGNIGVTTTQQMLQSEREVAQFCMVDYIVNDFISRFCVMVY